MKKAEIKKINFFMGWMTNEKYILRKLEQLAAKGWLYDSCTKFHVILKQGVPRKMQYAIDLPPIEEEEREEYLKYFESVGWHLAYKNYCFYVFYADKNAPSLHTDQTLQEQVRDQWQKKMVPRAILFLALTMFFIILGKAPVPSWLQILCFPLTVISGGLSAMLFYSSISLSHIHHNHNNN